jgi:hypothetical protein
MMLAFHREHWAYKFAAVSNLPAVLGALARAPLAVIWPGMADYVMDLTALLFVPPLWYWVGSRLDRRWCLPYKTHWIALSLFTAGCLGEAFCLSDTLDFCPLAS